MINVATTADSCNVREQDDATLPLITQSADHRIISVSLGDRSYDIVVGQNLLSTAGTAITRWLQGRFGSSSQQKGLIITDSNVARHAELVQQSLQASGMRTEILTLEPGENAKRLENISAGWDKLVQMHADRRTLVVAVGGGVVGDAAGFVAATFARGVPFVQVPTTLLADVDSSVGGKVGINHPLAKNLIGAFHQPFGVLIDLRALETLPDREFRAGLAEVVKYGVILDSGFFEYLERNAVDINARDAAALGYAISRSCELKAQVVEEDEYETTGLRAVLNYGHTFGHAFEALAGYGELLHGEGVSIGMIYASRLAERLGRISAAETQRQLALLEAFGLPVNLPNPAAFSADDVLDRMLLDKKTVGGSLRFVLPTRIGHVELVKGVPVALVRDVLQAGGIH
ncbi:3-dehydroquinate synthase [Planctomicrobium sp. SH664]|uniref:3-dehydroquinate synthase n=1 Tax=Planctomicrobium sp. SH664 TaxID=3448125 RepID=UPI003F5C66F6